MRFTLLAMTLALALLAGALSAQSFVVVPNGATAAASGNGVNTPIRDAPRTYQWYLHRSQLTGINSGDQITSIQYRLSSGATAAWPNVAATWNQYDMQVSQSDAASFAANTLASTIFATNLGAGLTTVRSGPFSVPANIAPVGNPAAFVLSVPFTTPYTYTAGTDIVITLRLTGYTGGATQEFLDSWASMPNVASAMSAIGANAVTGAAIMVASVQLTVVAGGDQEIDVERWGTQVPPAGTDNIGSLLVGTGTVFTWDLFNLGVTSPLNIITITAVPGGVANCTAAITSATPPFTITAGSQAALDIDVTPTATGAFQFTITITSNSITNAVYTFIVQGTAITNAPPTLTLATGTTFAAGADFDLALDPGVTLSQADLDVDDATPDHVLLQIGFVNGPMGLFTPPTNITMTAGQLISSASLPFTISWTGTVDANDDPGTYGWWVRLDDNFTAVTFDVHLIINDLDPTHAAVTGVTGDGLTAGTAYTKGVQIGAAGAVGIADCDDANLSQTITVASETNTASPAGSTLSFTFGMVGTNPATLRATPSAAPAQADVGDFDYDVVIEDNNGNQVTIFVTITVVAGVVPAINSALAPTTATVGVQYTHTFTATGTPTPTLSAAGLPLWLTFTPATGVLSGTPASADVGTAGPITVTANNGVNPADTQVFSIIVSAAGGVGGGGGGGGGGGSCTATSGTQGLLLLLSLYVLLGMAIRTRRA